MFLPILALIAWTLLIVLWMVVVRMPEMMRASRAGNAPTNHATKIEAEQQYSPRTRWKGDNANNLFEQPTIFYALALITMLSGHADFTAVWMAWAYVILRVLHSLWHCLVNVIPVRSAIFFLSTLVLIIMTVRLGMQLFNYMPVLPNM